VVRLIDKPPLNKRRKTNKNRAISTLAYIVIIVLVIAVIAGVIILTRTPSMPTNPSSSAQAPVTIVFTGWVSSGAEYQFDQEMVNAFNAQHTDVQVVFQPITSDYDTKLKTEIAAGNAPDVFYVDSSQVFSYVQNGLLLPLNQFVNSDSSYNISDFIPETLNAFKFNNNIYAIPKDWSPLALFYNVKMFEQAGISSPPSTWQQLYQDAAKLTVKSNGKVVTYGLALPPDMARILAFVYQGGGQWITPSGKSVATNSSQFITALNYTYQLIQQGYATMPSAVGAGWDGQAFGEGLAAMTIEGNWMIPYMNQTYPNVTYSVAPLPAGPAGRATLLFTVGLAIPYNDKHPQQAWEFIKFFTSVQGQTKWVELGLALPTRMSLFNLPYYQNNPDAKALMSEFSYAHPWSFPTANFAKVYNDANAILQNLFLNKITLEQAIEQLTMSGDSDLSSST
jgi:multiple sugar transport system substrate-binding protein